MDGRKNVVQLEYKQDVDSLINDIDELMSDPNKPELVYIKMSSKMFPRRVLDLPEKLRTLLGRNPRIKVEWNGEELIKVSENYVVNASDQLAKISNSGGYARQFGKAKHKYLDMTLITCHYGGTVNQLRKSAMNKAIANWFKQDHLPNQILFIELVIDEDAAFSQQDFPSDIRYIRISGNTSNKNIFQKECLWNIGLKLTANEKIMFIDYDTSPIGNCDWFKKVYDELDKSLFTQGFRKIMYLDESENIILNKNSITYDLVNGTQKSTHPVPGGSFCIAKSTLQKIGGFNSTCFYGGGDNLFFNEILDEKNKQHVKNISVEIFVRKTVYHKLLELSVEQKKEIVGSVDVDTYHFYHGNLSNRSYGVRTYLALMMFPFSNYFFVDDMGLLAWKTTNIKLYDMFGSIETINNSMKIANYMIGNDINLNDWKSAIDKVQNNYYVNKNISIVKRMLTDTKKKFGV